MTGWQPISSAPKNGARILTWGCIHDDGDVRMGETPAVSFSFWDRETGTWYCEEWGSHQPTHWMPLPNGPQR
jgi:hypothetical protein